MVTVGVGVASFVSVIIDPSDPESLKAVCDTSAGLSHCTWRVFPRQRRHCSARLGLEHMTVQWRNMFVKRALLLSEIRERAFLKVGGLHNFREAFGATGLFAL